MASDNVSSTYSRYRHDTAVVSSWLVRTAKQLGFDKPLAKPARLKGKARKEASKNGSNGNASFGRRYQHVLALKDFVPLAEFIAAADQAEPALVPAQIATTVDRIVGARKSFSKGLPDAPAVPRQDFVSTLEQVRDILKPRAEEAALPRPGLDVPALSLGTFEGLMVYQTPDSLFDDADVALSAPDYEPESEDTATDALFAFATLAQDAAALRATARKLWKEYKAEMLNIESVSVACNTSIGLFRRMEDEVASLAAKQGGFFKWATPYFIAVCVATGQQPPVVYPHAELVTPQTYEAADVCMFNSWDFLTKFARTSRQYVDQVWWYDPTIATSVLPPQMQLLQDRALMAEMVRDAGTLAVDVKGNPVEDELTRGIGMLRRKGGQVPFWLVLAFQMFLDTFKLLADIEPVERPFNEMYNWSEWIGNAVQTTLDFRQKISTGPDDWPRSQEVFLQRTVKECRFWTVDPIAPILSANPEVAARQCPFQFPRRHALFCGLWIHHIRTAYFQAGVAVASHSGSVVLAGHLYKALEFEEPLPAWADMDMIMAMPLLSPDGHARGFSVGAGIPHDAQGWFENFCLSIGCSADDWPPGKQRRRQKIRPRALPQPAKISILLREMPRKDSNVWTGMTADDVQEVVGAGRRFQEALGLTETDPGENKSSGEEDQPKAESGKPGVVVLSKLVVALTYALQTESAAISFNYLTMHYLCRAVLIDIYRSLQNEEPTMVGMDEPAHGNEMPLVAGFVLMLAGARGQLAAKAAENASSANAGDEPPHTLIRCAINTLNNIIQSSGTRIIDQRPTTLMSKIKAVPVEQEPTETEPTEEPAKEEPTQAGP